MQVKHLEWDEACHAMLAIRIIIIILTTFSIFRTYGKEALSKVLYVHNP